MLRYYLPAPRYWLTSALPATEWSLNHIDLVAASSYLNFINVMSYDFAGPWTSQSGYHSQLFLPNRSGNTESTSPSGHGAISYFISAGVDPEKLILGIPVYGRSFLCASAAGQRYSGHGGDDGTFEYCDLPRPGTKEMVDEELGSAYCVGGDGGFVSYDNPQTVRAKARYVKRNGLGGLFYWNGTGDKEGAESLVINGFEGLHTHS
jgi:chitinase